MTAEQIKKDGESFYKLKIFMLVNDALDRMEERGFIEILNDYENEQILVRKNQYNLNRRDESGFVV